MKVDASVVKHLNKLLKNELTAINQYFLHGRTLRHWGFERLGKKIYEESIGEMKHADHLIKRILLLEGLPNLQDLGKLEYAARTDMVAAVAHFESVKDYVSRDLVTDLLEDTEKHIDFLETELELVQKVGLQNYLQTQIGEGPSS